VWPYSPLVAQRRALERSDPRFDMADFTLHIQRRKKDGGNLPHPMTLNIKDQNADRLVRELAAETGESLTTAVTVSVRERLERLRGAVPREQRRAAAARISQRCAARPIRDTRPPDEILGYGDDGLPS